MNLYESLLQGGLHLEKLVLMFLSIVWDIWRRPFLLLQAEGGEEDDNEATRLKTVS
jgi:hypothetical protein